MHRTSKGVSLIELIVVVAIGALLLGIALPGIGTMVERQRTASVHNQLAAAFSHARLLALTRRSQAIVCPTSDGVSCRSDGVWEDGWLTFVDRDEDAIRDAAESIERYDTPSTDALRIRTSVHRKLVRFRRNGLSRGGNLTLRMCGAQHAARAGLILNNGGRVRAASRAEVRGLPPC
jgi:type IV fimbrial biogenesis protein FimT